MDSSICRFCLEPEGKQQSFIQPCVCRGTSAYVHHHCLLRWQTTVLLNRGLRENDENRHLLCSACKAPWTLEPPTYEQMVLTILGEEIVSMVTPGMLLVASRYTSNPIPQEILENMPHALVALLQLKKAHWNESIYLLFSETTSEENSNTIFGLNLTREVDDQIPEQVLAFRDANPNLRVIHHYGGPVGWGTKIWSSIQIPGEVLVTLRPDLLERMHLLESMDSKLVIGDFEDIAEVVDDIIDLGYELARVHVFSGCARWTRNQLLNEIVRGSWGCISSSDGLQHHMTEELDGLWSDLAECAVESTPNAIKEAHQTH